MTETTIPISGRIAHFGDSPELVATNDEIIARLGPSHHMPRQIKATWPDVLKAAPPDALVREAWVRALAQNDWSDLLEGVPVEAMEREIRMREVDGSLWVAGVPE